MYVYMYIYIYIRERLTANKSPGTSMKGFAPPFKGT